MCWSYYDFVYVLLVGVWLYGKVICKVGWFVVCLFSGRRRGIWVGSCWGFYIFVGWVFGRRIVLWSARGALSIFFVSVSWVFRLFGVRVLGIESGFGVA